MHLEQFRDELLWVRISFNAPSDHLAAQHQIVEIDGSGLCTQSDQNQNPALA